jgi:hypothetical protein
VLRAKNVQWMFSLRLPSFLVKDRDYRIHVSTAPSLKKKKKKKKKLKKKKKKKKKKENITLTVIIKFQKPESAMHQIIEKIVIYSSRL